MRDKIFFKLGDCYFLKQGDIKDIIIKEKRKDYLLENFGEFFDQLENDFFVVKSDVVIQSGSKWGIVEDLIVVEWMFDMVKIIVLLVRKLNFVGWVNDICLMCECDGCNYCDMCVLFCWVCQDNFWFGNVLSSVKFCDKWI